MDDGSSDSDELRRIVSGFEGVRLETHARNLGMCAARNTGIAASSGRYVTLLDADDEFIAGWDRGFKEIIANWPDGVHVVFTPCIDEDGELTCSEPDYKGYLFAEDIVQERRSGEYNPIFLGDYIRSRGYIDLGMRKSCGILTYLNLSREAPFWISDKVQRIYRRGGQSVTSGWTRPEKADETGRCFNAVLARHGEFIQGVSKRSFRRMQYKAVVYEMLSGRRPSLSGLVRIFSWSNLPAWFALLVMRFVGPKVSAWALRVSKHLGAVRRYG